MLNTIEAIVQNGQIILLENEENEFWLLASKSSLDEIWNNENDNIYAELLKK